MDVQGFEDRVLRGAREMLSSVASIEMEISLTELYVGQANWHDMLGQLIEEFTVIDIRTGFRDQQSRLLQADVSLLRSGL